MTTALEIQTFVIEPLRPLAELRANALHLTPPREGGELLASELVEVASLDRSVVLDMRYATTNNFLQTALYSSPRAYLQKPAAEALVRVHRRLEKDGFAIAIFDAYRPWYVTKMFWEATPEAYRMFVADPELGSRHNRGCAVDASMIELSTRRLAEMPSGFDEFTDRANAHYTGGEAKARANRDHLRLAMAEEGFEVLPNEWWHFDFRGWDRYPILNTDFSVLETD